MEVAGSLDQALLFSDDFTVADVVAITGVLVSEDANSSTTLLRFIAVEGGAGPPAQALQITSASDNSVLYAAAFSADTRAPSWNATLSRSSNTLTAGTGEEIAVQPQITGLAPGTYLGQIQIAVHDGSRSFDRVMGVTLTILSRVSSASLPIAVDRSMDLPPRTEDGSNAPSAIHVTSTSPVSLNNMLTHPTISSAPAKPASNEDRILGVIPNYQTVNDPHVHVAALTAKQKWGLALRETVDPFNIVSAAMGAGLSQWGNETPKYGEGGVAYSKRFAAAVGDLATQNLFSAGVLANLLHQDPRYFRKGPEYSVLHRISYSVSRIVVTRQDSGRSAFNASGVFGMVLGIAASNLYYPPESQKWEVMAGRLNTTLTSSVIGNLLSEFWPDLQEHVLHRHRAPAR